jgi:hypothetical protein
MDVFSIPVHLLECAILRTVHRRRSGQSVALHPRVTLVAGDSTLDGDGRILISFTRYGEREMGAAQRAVNVMQ